MDNEVADSAQSQLMPVYALRAGYPRLGDSPSENEAAGAGSVGQQGSEERRFVHLGRDDMIEGK